MEDKKKKLTLGVLTLIMMSVWYFVLGSPDFLLSLKSNKKKSVSSEKKSDGLVNDETLKIILTKYQKKSAQHLNFENFQPLAKIDMKEVLEFRDPFRIFDDKKNTAQQPVENSNKKNRKSPELNLQGIVWDEIQPNAVINGEVVAKGDKISGYIVQEVRKDRVVLIKNGKQTVLWEP